jgi:hypothetical protein
VYLFCYFVTERELQSSAVHKFLFALVFNLLRVRVCVCVDGFFYCPTNLNKKPARANFIRKKKHIFAFSKAISSYKIIIIVIIKKKDRN